MMSQMPSWWKVGLGLVELPSYAKQVHSTNVYKNNLHLKVQTCIHTNIILIFISWISSPHNNHNKNGTWSSSKMAVWSWLSNSKILMCTSKRQANASSLKCIAIKYVLILDSHYTRTHYIISKCSILAFFYIAEIKQVL